MDNAGQEFFWVWLGSSVEGGMERSHVFGVLEGEANDGDYAGQELFWAGLAQVLRE